VMMSSASIDHSMVRYQNGFYHLWRYVFYVALACGAGFAVACTPMRIWLRYGWACLLVGFVLLVLVIIPGVGREVNGSMRWIPLGPINLQSSEVAKFCVLVYLAGYLVRRETEVRENWMGFIKPIGVVSVLIALLILEPDFGSVVVLFGACLGMLFLGGARLLQFLLVMLVGLAAAALLIYTSPYRMQRLLTYLDPWADQFNTGYQLTQSLIAFGRGEWLGLGLGNSVQKQFYLPEAHTDFVFAIIAEELGFVGAFVVIVLFSLLFFRMLRIARRAEQGSRHFAAYLVYGVVLVLASQVFINIGVNTGLLPTKGLTLPFLSYGGSSLLVVGAFMGLTLRVEYDNRSVVLPELTVKRALA
ncbi:MAG: putative lipid II flippase FtsW, partial [Gammaproteobacteria bacterium]